MRTCFVYLLASKQNVTLYVGVTNYDWYYLDSRESGNDNELAEYDRP